MTRPRIVNRSVELALFDQMVNRQIEERILLIRAESGMGKSLLLSEFEKRCPKEIIFVPIDFKGGGVNLAEIFSRARDWIGRDKFSKFSEIVENYIHKSIVTISDNNLFGRNKIDIALSGSDQDSLEERRVNLTDAFLADLQLLGKVLFVFDTFNACQEVVGIWIASGFLPRFRLNQNLMAVLAGQNVPQPTLEWTGIHREIHLEGISETHWLEFAKLINSQASEEFIKGFSAYRHGHPLEMATMLHTFVSKERAQ